MYKTCGSKMYVIDETKKSELCSKILNIPHLS